MWGSDVIFRSHKESTSKKFGKQCSRLMTDTSVSENNMPYNSLGRKRRCSSETFDAISLKTTLRNCDVDSWADLTFFSFYVDTYPEILFTSYVPRLPPQPRWTSSPHAQRNIFCVKINRYMWKILTSLNKTMYDAGMCHVVFRYMGTNVYWWTFCLHLQIIRKKICE